METVLITGASGGIGAAIALQIIEDHGYHVILHYHSNEQSVINIQSRIVEMGGTCDIMKFDVSKKSQVVQALDEWTKSNPDKFISILVNNAGITKDGLFMWMNEQDWDDVLDVSLKGMYNVTQHLIQPMLKNRWGRIINISSLSGLKGVPGQVNYSAAKGGVIAATKALAQEVAKRNITVNAVAPGFIETEMSKDENNELYRSFIPMQRFGTPEEVGHLVSFLASKNASYITGEVININGGLYT